MLDLDNTIVPWHTAEIVPAAQTWVVAARHEGLRFCLLTNNYGAQAAAVARRLEMPVVRAALKPNPAAFRRALMLLDVSPQAGLAVGDQLFTDVLGAKLAGMRAVLVEPIGGREFPTTKLMRLAERPILRYLTRRGRIPA